MNDPRHCARGFGTILQFGNKLLPFAGQINKDIGKKYEREK